MKVVLGIDTGGTYTDSVLYDAQNQELIDKNKALTTHSNLTIGISNTIDGLDQVWFEKIELVALSTTLATNSIVKGNGARVGLLLLGYENEILKKFDFDQEIPAEEIEVVAGKFDVKGREIEKLDQKKVKKLGFELQDRVDVLAVSGYMSVRNPEHEVKAKQILKETTKLPVVCGHKLTNQLNLIKRTTTVVLNASLIPLIKELTQKVRDALHKRGISAPIMMVKGDGSVVKDKLILNSPIETFLSGPAASIIGAKHLSQNDNGIVVDMGGTTTDISLFKDGYPQFDSTGVMIGDWSTNIESIKFRTVGLGGDSEIRLNKAGEIKIGPQQVIPYAVASTYSQKILPELQRIKDNRYGIKDGQFLILNRIPNNISLSKREKELIGLLESGPKSLLQVKNQLEVTNFDFLGLTELERIEVIKRIGLTPTDILHLLGEYDKWNIEAAKLGYQLLINNLKFKLRDKLLRDKFEVDEDNFAWQIKQRVVKQIAKEIAMQLISENYEKYEETEVKFHEELLEAVLTDEFIDFDWNFNPKVPIIAVGAPAQAYLQEIDSYLKTEVVVPKDYEVANAIGAAVANIIIKEEALIKAAGGRSILHSSKERKEFSNLNKAINYAKESSRKRAVSKAKAAGAKEIDIDCEVNKKKEGKCKVTVTVIGDTV